MNDHDRVIARLVFEALAEIRRALQSARRSAGQLGRVDVLRRRIEARP